MRKKCISVVLVFVMLTIISFPATSFAGLATGTKFLGNILSMNIETDSNFATYWNQVTPENAGKWSLVEKSRDVFDWSKLDDDYNYAKSKGFPFKEHTFIWGMSEPSWLKSLPAADIRAEIEEWIQAYFERYPDTKYADVVNEPIHQKPSQEVRNALGGDTNWAWVKWLYEKANIYKPSGCILLINEFDILKNSGTRSTYKQIINMLISNNLLGGIGMQGHWLESTSANTIKTALDEMDDYGLPLFISEYDVNSSNDNTQKDIYASQFPVFWTHPGVKGVTMWGYKQGSIWRDDAYLLRSNGSERPALQWMRDYLGAPLINDTFNEMTTGQAPAGWTISNSGGTVNVEYVPGSSSDRCIKQADNSTTADTKAVKSFYPQSGKFTAEFKMMMPSKVDTFNVNLKCGSTKAICFGTCNNGNLGYKNSSGTYVTLQNYNANQWYTIKIIADVATDKCDIYIDNTLKASQVAFANAVSSVDTFSADTASSNTGTMYIDNVKITK
mgnify:CR=1 FL=1